VSHTHNTELINRLKRAQGHLTKIITMIEEDRDGLDTAQQLQAVVSALEKAKTVLVADHIEHHLEDAVGPLPKEAREKLKRLVDLAKYL
jgi:DNA-binding FrmR family transcriptional regulator